MWNDTNVEWHEVEELIPHKKFVGAAHIDLPYDIGLIRLKKKILYNKNVQPVNLPTSDNVEDEFAAVAIGWGKLSVSKIFPRLLYHFNNYLFHCMNQYFS